MVFERQPDNFNPKFEVVSCFCNFGGKILLLKRHPAKPEGGTWCLPGGKVDLGETLEVAMKRELFEEAGIFISESKLEYKNKFFVAYADYEFVFHHFLIELKREPSIVLRPKEHTQFRWETIEATLQLNLIQDEDVCIKLTYDPTFSLV